MPNSIEEVIRLNEENWPECAQTSNPALLRLTQVNNIFIQIINEVIADYDLQPIEFNLLTCLRRQPSPHKLSPTELYQTLLFSSGGLTKVLVRLEHAGLIERSDNPNDKRSKLVTLSSKGKQLLETVMPILHERQRQMLLTFSPEEVGRLDEFMRRIAQNMNKGDESYPKSIRFFGPR